MKTGTLSRSTSYAKATSGFYVALAFVQLACSREYRAVEVLPISVLRVEIAVNRLVENSVAVTSRRQPGIIFGLNDSGNQPQLFAFDSSGRGRGFWKVEGATNRDWEAASLGPCVPADGKPSCIYIGDVGDNDARRTVVAIYRIAEPDAAAIESDDQQSIRVLDRLNIRYPDRAHDVEAMFVAPDGSLFLITKRRLLDAEKRARPALIFSLPGSAWDSSGVVIATLRDSLPHLIPGAAEGMQVNDASLSADGKLLAVRTYAEVFVFRVDSMTYLPERGQSPALCSIRALKEEQGEGIAWWWDRRRLVLTSERRNAPFHVVECPLPMR